MAETGPAINILYVTRLTRKMSLPLKLASMMKADMILKGVFIFKLLSTMLAVLCLVLSVHALNMFLQISLSRGDLVTDEAHESTSAFQLGHKAVSIFFVSVRSSL